MEEFILALNSRGIKTANLLSEEVTLGNYLRLKLSGKNVFNYRRHPDIAMVDNLTIHTWPLRWSRDARKRRLSNILQKAKKQMAQYIAREGKPDLLFHHGIFDYTYITRELSQHFDIPYWYKEHSSYINEGHYPCTNDFESAENLRQFVQGAGRRFAPSGAYCDKLSKVFDAPFEVLHNYLNDDYFNGGIIHQKEKPFTFLNVAVMTPAKNQQLILTAFAQLLELKNVDARLIIAGDGALRQKLLNLCAQLGISEKVDILTYQNRASIRRLLDESQCFVLASQLETFGLVLVEAMARGLPVISSRIPGPMEVVNERNGIFFQPDDAYDLTRAMEEMLVRHTQYDRECISAEAKANYGPDTLNRILLNHPLFKSKINVEI